MGWWSEDHPDHEGYTVGLVLIEPPKVRCQRTPRKNPHDCKRSCPGDRYGDPCVPVGAPTLNGEGETVVSEEAEAFLAWLSAGDKWRELRYPEKYEGPIRRVQAACACGWRSQPMTAPTGTSYMPHVVCFSEFHVEAADADILAQWKHHLSAPAPTRLASASATPTRAPRASARRPRRELRRARRRPPCGPRGARAR